ncbi:MAG TPA: neutral zinc metallopeptidase [Allosphingosinicella sp.]|uniref:KPN_02809 family neutral zinc metallopeptidase n=1 Tax=Allosphingosinicella sp. TaxID=2823234 RepID=UPI002ED86435
MRFGGRRTSSNVGMQTGRGGGGFGFPMGGGGGFNMGGGGLGCGGIVILLILALVFGINPMSLLGGGGQMVGGGSQVERTGADQACNMSETNKFSCQVLASTEDQWSRLFQAQGQQYRPASMDFYNRAGQSGCGAAQSAMGPFYCLSDQRIYIDPAFFDELRTRFQAPGDFAQAYVIAHEVGHHVQTITGTADRIRQAQSRASKAEGNALQVAMELQADCYAGVWAATERAAIESGDIEEGMRAAEAIGDDTLQKAAQGYVVPESFTHGTSAQRQQALQRGLQSGDPAACDVYTANI